MSEGFLVWRRFTDPYSEWGIAMPVLFALAVLFTISCLRQEKGIGTLLLGFAMILIVPLIMAYDYKSHGAMPAVEFSEWSSGVALLLLFAGLCGASMLLGNSGIGTMVLGAFSLLAGLLLAIHHWTDGDYHLFAPLSAGLSAIGRLPHQYPYAAELTVKCLLGLIVGGFAANMLMQFAAPLAVSVAAGVAGLLAQVVWVLLQPTLIDGLKELGVKETLPFQIAPYVLLFFVQVVISSVRSRTLIGLAIILGLSIIYAPFALWLHPYLSWVVVLAPLLTVALFYVVMMYIHDARTIHWAWAIFLGLLRCCVYAMLLIVFLQPGMQFLETTEVQPKIIILFDVSDSMNHKDELAPPGGVADLRLSRQQQVVAFVTADGEGEGKKKAWIRRILEKTPATVYRFGKRLDESYVEQLPQIKDPDELTGEEKERLTAAYWNKFLHLDVKQVKDEVLARSDMKKVAAEIESLEKKLEMEITEEEKKSYGDRLEDLKRTMSDEVLRREEAVRELLNGTDVPGSVNRASDLEKSNYVQAIIVVSDGRSNYTGVENALSELLARVNNGERKVPIFTVGVGAYKQPAEILAIDDMKAPSNARPDEKFLVQVPVKGTLPLKGEASELYLEARRTKDAQNNSLAPNWWSRRTLPSYAFPVRKGSFVEYSNFTWLEDDDLKEKALRPVPPMTFEIDLVRIFQEREPKLVGDFLKAEGAVKFNEETFKTLKAQELDFMRFALQHKGGVDIGKAVEKFTNRGLDPAKIQVEFKTMFMEKFIEGEWEFAARVPRNRDEEYEEDWHVSKPPARVQVRDKKPRILLVGGGPTREYQFVRTLLAREAQQKRLELSIFLQSGAQDEGVDQDVPPERLLSHFPHRRGPEVVSTDKYSSINSYDLIIAIDPDWSALNVNLPDQPSDPKKRIKNRHQAKLISNWVLREGGGIIFVTGPMNGFALSIRPKDDDDETDSVGDLPDLVPVVLADSRTVEERGIDLKRPFALTFTKDARKNDFLNLDADPKGDIDDPKIPSDSPPGWDKFFWGEGLWGRPGAEPKRGFFDSYPVLSLRNDTTVLATFNGPRPTKTEIKGEQPWLAAMRAGSGKTLYIGSPETWRLRQYKESYHETFWLNAIRFATSGSQQREKFGGFLASRKTPVGSFGFDVQIKDAVRIKVGDDSVDEKKTKKGEGNEAIVPGDWHPRAGAFRQKVYLRKRGDVKDGEPFDLRSKATDGPWQGWFEGNVKLKEEGEYELVVKIFATKENNPETTEVLVHQLEVFRPRLEDENLKEDFTATTGLKALASDAEAMVVRMKGELDPFLEPKDDRSAEGRRLFFLLSSGTIVPECLLIKEPLKSNRIAGIRDIWDRGMSVPLYHLLWSVPLVLFLLFGSISMYHQKWFMGSVLLVLAVIVPVTVAAIPWFGEATGWYSEPQWSTRTVEVASVLVIVVSLLAVEWLTRKLLKLA